MPRRSPALIAAIAVANIIHWYLVGGAFLISDDAEYWNGSVIAYQGHASLSREGLLSIIGGRASAVSYVGYLLLVLLGGSIARANIVYSSLTLSLFLFGMYRVGRAARLDEKWSLLLMSMFAVAGLL